MKLYLYILSISLVAFSCGQKSCSYAILGGEIINKNADFVVLLYGKQVIDTVPLDKNNRFNYKIKNLDAGFYTFNHGNEIQKVLLEPGDSLLFRLNTLEFDESLVYTGKGAKKNNYLINDFIQNEIDEKRIYKLCMLSPEAYVKHIDSMRDIKNKKLKHFQEKNIPSPLFNKIAQANIDYNYFSNKEAFPFLHYRRKKRKQQDNVPDNFYAYRQNINYNDAFLINHFIYRSFLKRSFKNIALSNHLKHSSKTKDHIWTNCCFNLDQLAVIDSLVQDETIKNQLLYNFSLNFLHKNNKIENNAKVVNYFLSKSTDTNNNAEISSYSASINQLKPGATFPSIALRNLDNDVVNIKSIIDKPTVVYFWSHNNKNYFRNTHKRASELHVKYPEISFISVNIDDYNKDAWATTLKKHKQDNTNKEYVFESPKESVKRLAVYPLTKTILVNKEHKIFNGHANMFSKNFEQELLGLLNQF